MDILERLEDDLETGAHGPRVTELLRDAIAEFRALRSSPPRSPNEHAIEIGRELARQLFGKRGNHSEAHLSELELAAMCALAAERAFALPTVEAVSQSHRFWPQYTTEIGDAGHKYLQSVSLDGRYHLSGTFRWYELWDALNRAAVGMAIVDELALLVRRLAHSLKSIKPDNPLVAQAVDYLKRQGLQGSALKTTACSPTAAEFTDRSTLLLGDDSPGHEPGR
jgi:hypothetical protein